MPRRQLSEDEIDEINKQINALNIISDTNINNCSNFFMQEIKMNDEYIKQTCVDTILEQSVEQSMVQATRQAPFDANISEKNFIGSDATKKTEEMKSIAKDLKKKAEKHILKRIKNLKNILDNIDDENSIKNEYRNWHNNVCLELIGIFADRDIIVKEKNNWSYGNSQKVLNLTIKYIYEIQKKLIELNLNNHNIFNECPNFYDMKPILDITVDSLIIDGIKEWNNNNPDKKIDLPIDQNSKIIPWSKWNSQNYNEFVSHYSTVFSNENFSPIEWESVTWTKFMLKKKLNN